MKGVAVLFLLLLNVHFAWGCILEGSTLFCTDVPSAFVPGFSTLVMVLKDVGELNSTLLRSEDLVSVTSLRIEDAGITVIADGAFRSLQNLTALSLNQNLLTEVNPDWFYHPAVLHKLRMTGNHMEVLNKSMFNRLTGLTHLSLGKNRIREINPDTFSSQSRLAELDLSDNSMTWVSPQVFRSLRSASVRLDGNPWDCSCRAEDFVDSVKDLKSKSLLDRPSAVTCEGPPPLRGQPVWNVSACEMSPSPGPPTTPGPLTTPSIRPKPTDTHPTATVHTGSLLVSPGSSPARPPPGTKPPSPPGPSDIPTTVTTTTLKTITHIPLNPSWTEVSVLPEPSEPTKPESTSKGMTANPETCPTSQPSEVPQAICILAVVIVVLSSLLCVVCFLVALYRRKRINKSVMPAKENLPEGRESSSGSSRSVGEGKTEHLDSEAGWRRSFNGVRAKSANAILFLSPSCASLKDELTLQTETEAQSKDAEQPGQDTDIQRGDEMQRSTNTTKEKDNQAFERKDLDESPQCVSVSADPVPYLSIGTNQTENSPAGFNAQLSQNETLKRGKVLERISTWPPTATQWQERCQIKEEEEKEKPEVFTVWTAKPPDDEEREAKGEEHPFDSVEEKNQTDDLLKTDQAPLNLGASQSSKSTESMTDSTRPTTADTIQHSSPPTKKKPDQDPDLTPTEEILNESRGSSMMAEKRKDPHGAATFRQQRAGVRSSEAPSGGGSSPDDETLLSGNEYAFMDLLHEVVQNNGRWTRERWKQTHINKQRR